MKKNLVDSFGRKHTYLRLSLTDKCNLHCSYCNPITAKFSGVHTKELLSRDEIVRLVSLFVQDLGIDKVRLTGGEPMVRKDFLEILESLHSLKQIHPFKLGITTNGTFLNDNIHALKRFGVDSLNISLDSLQSDKFFRITQGNNYFDVYNAIIQAKESGFFDVKVNAVIMRGINDDEILDFTRFAIEHDLNVRFIEFMPFQNNGWGNNYFVSYHELKKKIQSNYFLIPIPSHESAVSKDFSIERHKGTVSFITSVSEHFCGGCNRLRITSQGKLKTCLFSTHDQELDVRELLRNPVISDETIACRIQNTLIKKWYQHPDTETLQQQSHNTMVGIGG